MIKTIVFDYTGVVAPGPLGAWVRQNLVVEDKMHAFIKESSHRWDLGEVSLEETYVLISEITGIEPENIWKTLFEDSTAHDDVIELIKSLKKNYRIVMFSNHISGILRKLLAKHEIVELFDEIIISSEHKMKKPDPRFFHKMLELIGNTADEIVFIDDTQENIEAATKLGIKSIQFQNSEQLIKDLESSNINLHLLI